MIVKRSYSQLVVGSFAAALLIANCTVKEDTDGSCEKGDKLNECACPGGVRGSQVCGSDGTFGPCLCPDGTLAAATRAAAAAVATRAAAPVCREGGASVRPAARAARARVTTRAAHPTAARAASPLPFSIATSAWKRFARMSSKRVSRRTTTAFAFPSTRPSWVASRWTALRTTWRGTACAAAESPSGRAPDPDLVGLWAPETMTQETTDLINCLATSSSDPPSDDWADVSGPNFPDDAPPRPWPADSCAKLACTSKFGAP